MQADQVTVAVGMKVGWSVQFRVHLLELLHEIKAVESVLSLNHSVSDLTLLKISINMMRLILVSMSVLLHMSSSLFQFLPATPH